MLYDVVAAEARPGFKVWVRFENGVEGEADLSDLAGRGVFERWTEKNHKPEASAVEMATEMGVALLTEDQYRRLQQLGPFDTGTSLDPPMQPCKRSSGSGLVCPDRQGGHVTG